MVIPKVSDFPQYVSSQITGDDWNTMITDIVNMTTDGTKDFNIRQLTAQYLFGDISGCTGFPSSDMTVLAGETITAGQFLRISSSSAFVATTASNAGISNLAGFALADASSGASVTIRTVGLYSGLTGLTAGTVYYLSTSGALTSTKPSSRAVPVCFSISTTTVLISKFGESNTTFPNLNTTGQFSGVYSDASEYTLSWTNTHASGISRALFFSNNGNNDVQIGSDPVNSRAFVGTSSPTNNFIYIYEGSSGYFRFDIQGTEKFRITSAANTVLGGTLLGWTDVGNVAQIANSFGIAANDGSAYDLWFNSYTDGGIKLAAGTAKYGARLRYEGASGNLTYVASTTTANAGDTITFANILTIGTMGDLYRYTFQNGTSASPYTGAAFISSNQAGGNYAGIYFLNSFTDDSAQWTEFRTTGTGGSQNTNQLVLYKDGNVGINQAVPTYKLHVNGDSNFVNAASFGTNSTYTADDDFAVSLLNDTNSDEVKMRFMGKNSGGTTMTSVISQSASGNLQYSPDSFVNAFKGAGVFSTQISASDLPSLGGYLNSFAAVNMDVTKSLVSPLILSADVGGAQTLDNLIYQYMPNLTGAATVTNKYMFGINAALGTHVGTTNQNKTGNTVVGSLKMYVSGTLVHIPVYSDT